MTNPTSDRDVLMAELHRLGQSVSTVLERIDRLAEQIEQSSEGPYTIAQFATKVGKTPTAIRTAIHRGQIVASRPQPRVVRISHEELVRFRNEGKRRA